MKATFDRVDDNGLGFSESVSVLWGTLKVKGQGEEDEVVWSNKNVKTMSIYGCKFYTPSDNGVDPTIEFIYKYKRL